MLTHLAEAAADAGLAAVTLYDNDGSDDEELNFKAGQRIVEVSFDP